jgi:hypothetical protein
LKVIAEQLLAALAHQRFGNIACLAGIRGERARNRNHPTQRQQTDHDS